MEVGLRPGVPLLQNGNATAVGNGQAHHHMIVGGHQPILPLDLISTNAPEPLTPHDQRRRAALLADSPERTSSSMSSYKPSICRNVLTGNVLTGNGLAGNVSPHEFDRVDVCLALETSDRSSTTSSSATVVATMLCDKDHISTRSNHDCSEANQDPQGCCTSSRSCRARIRDAFSGLTESAVWKSILLGQLLSLLLCTMSVLCQILVENYNIKIPAGQSIVTYFLLALIYSSLWCCRRCKRSRTRSGLLEPEFDSYKSASMAEVIKRRGIRYFFLSVSDVQANYLIHRAFQYTTLTSIQLLDCFSIPTVLILSWFVLRARYRLSHIGGLGLALMSVVALVWADVDDGRGGVSAGGKNRLMGDMLTLGGSFLFGISNIGLEHTVHFYDSHEFLGLVGVFGTIITAGQMCLLERDEILNIRWELWEVSVLLAAFTVAQLAFYICLPTMLRLSSAAALHLSLLSTDFYAIIAGVVFFQYKFHPLYLLSLCLVLLGLLIYSLQVVPMSSRKRSGSSFTEMHSNLSQCSPIHHRTSQSTLQSCCNNESNNKNIHLTDVHYTAARSAAIIQVHATSNGRATGLLDREM